jgi:hypothetical protein
MEGGRFQRVAERILAHLGAQDIAPMPLAELSRRILADRERSIPEAEILPRPIRGRAGLVAVPAGLEPVD